MSLVDGMSALNLEMPPRVPRTEYSAHVHWNLVKAVTGVEVSPTSPPSVQEAASKEFIKAWNYDFIWNTLTYNEIFNGHYTKMGHAGYAAGNVDFSRDISCPFNTPEEVLAFDPWEVYGPRDKEEIKRGFEAHYRKSLADFPDAVNMTGIYVTCMSGFIEIFGWDMLLTAAGMDYQGFGEVSDRYASWIGQYFDALASSDVPVVMVHDDIVWAEGAFIHPDWYRKYVFPHYKKHFASLIESGKKVMFTSDGNYTQFVDDIAACGVHGFVMEPLTDMRFVAEKYGKTHVFIGNADTRILNFGGKEQIKSEVERCMNIGKGCPGFFMAVGNHIPPNTPVENALFYNQVYEELSRR